MSTGTKKRQGSILMFSVETPRYAVMLTSNKETLAIKTKTQKYTNTQVWYDTVESKHSGLLRVCES